MREVAAAGPRVVLLARVGMLSPPPGQEATRQMGFFLGELERELAGRGIGPMNLASGINRDCLPATAPHAGGRP
jgi:hypothetical protein